MLVGKQENLNFVLLQSKFSSDFTPDTQKTIITLLKLDPTRGWGDFTYDYCVKDVEN